MKKSVKRILSLVLVLAVLMTSMVVSSVGAVTNPMQKVLIEGLKLSYTDKGTFVDALETAEQGHLDTAAPIIVSLFNDEISLNDVTSALSEFVDIASAEDRGAIKNSILLFSLNSVNYNGNNFNTIVSKVNTALTGESINGSYHDGVSLVIQGIQFLNGLHENGAYATDSSSDTSKIAFGYNTSDPLVELAKSQLSLLIDNMDTLNTKIDTLTGDTSFDKLLTYTANVINTSPADEISELKDYLDNLNDSFYQPYQAPDVTPPTGGGVIAPVVDEVTQALENLIKVEPTGTTAEINAYEKALETAVQNAIETAGTTAIAPTVTGTTAQITADQIKVADVVAKAEAVIAKATELAKQVGTANIDIEKKVVLDVTTNNVDKIDVALPADLLTKVQEKGIQKIEIDSGDVTLNFAPNFVADAKDAKTVSFQINKVAVTDDLKAKMTGEQKALLASNATVYDFNFSTVSSTGTETKITNFDKSIKIKVKYTLKAGENKDSLTVLFLGDDGKIQNMTGRYNEASGEIEFITNHFSTYVVKNLVKTFDDIKAGAWYKTQAGSLASKGIIEGRKGNNFEPNANITRAEFVTMLVKAKGVYDKNATSKFTDVNKSSWYYTYVASAIKAGIVSASGVGNNKFAPNAFISREQMATMLANALEEKTIANASSYLKSTDASKIANYAKNSMAICVKNGFIEGSNNKLDPKGPATRGMAAVVVYKYFNFIY